MPNTYTIKPQKSNWDAQVGPRKPVGEMFGASVRTSGLRFLRVDRRS